MTCMRAQRDEERKKDGGGKILEVRRQANGGPGERDRDRDRDRERDRGDRDRDPRERRRDRSTRNGLDRGTNDRGGEAGGRGKNTLSARPVPGCCGWRSTAILNPGRGPCFAAGKGATPHQAPPASAPANDDAPAQESGWDAPLDAEPHAPPVPSPQRYSRCGAATTGSSPVQLPLTRMGFAPVSRLYSKAPGQALSSDLGSVLSTAAQQPELIKATPGVTTMADLFKPRAAPPHAQSLHAGGLASNQDGLHVAHGDAEPDISPGAGDPVVHSDQVQLPGCLLEHRLCSL